MQLGIWEEVSPKHMYLAASHKKFINPADPYYLNLLSFV
jgi:hypothetical protein